MHFLFQVPNYGSESFQPAVDEETQVFERFDLRLALQFVKEAVFHSRIDFPMGTDAEFAVFLRDLQGQFRGEEMFQFGFDEKRLRIVLADVLFSDSRSNGAGSFS